MVNGKPQESKDRIVIPFTSDREIDRAIVIKLIDDTGFDAVGTGSLADSWQPPPGAPAYFTDLNESTLKAVIDTAEKERLPKQKMGYFHCCNAERPGNATANPDADYVVRLSRTLYMLFLKSGECKSYKPNSPHPYRRFRTDPYFYWSTIISSVIKIGGEGLS